MRDDLQNELDAYVLGDDDAFPPIDNYSEDGTQEIEPPPDADRANGMLRRLRGIEREVARIDVLADSEVRRIESWRSDRKSGLTRRAAAIETALEQWMRAVNRLNPKRKSESLPNGKVGLRAPGAGTVDVYDPKAFEEWWRGQVREELHTYIGRSMLDVDAIEEPAQKQEAFAGMIAEVLEMVLTRSPLMRIKPEVNKTALKELDFGPALPSPDGDPERVLLPVIFGDPPEGDAPDSREIIPGVAVVRSTVDTFSATPA